MELVYIRVIKHRLLENQEFNFNNKYRIHYNDTSECYEVEKPTYVQGFYGNNITNITAIVGDNGCGKSTLLRLLLSALPYENSKVSDDVIIFSMLEEDVLSFYSTALEESPFRIRDNGNEKSENVTSIYDQNGNYKAAQFKELKVIYCNNFLDYSDYFYRKYGEVDDLSFGGLLSGDYRKSMEMHQITAQAVSVESEHFEDVLSGQNQNSSALVGFDRNYAIGNYYNCEILRQLEFAFAYNDSSALNNLPFKIPYQIYLKLVPSKLSLNSFAIIKREIADLKTNGRDGNVLLGGIEILTNKLELSRLGQTKDDLIVLIAQSLFLNAINAICIPKVVPYDKQEYYDVLQILANCSSEADKLQTIESLTHAMQNWSTALESANHKGQHLLLIPYMNFMKWLSTYSSGLEFVDIQNGNATVNLNSQATREAFSEFIKLHINTNLNNRYIDFYWPLSSGEFNFFSLYARFFSILRRDESSGKYSFKRSGSHGASFDSAIILIDEADLTFHPKWQQRYIKSLVEFLSRIYKDYSVQVIFTTHSPILLSDIEHSSVIRIAKKIEEAGTFKVEVKTIEEKTFAQNIHTLFADSFVLDIKNLGETLGDFSYSKINSCLELLNNAIKQESALGSAQLNLIEYVIERIGEPVVSEMLTRKLIEYKKTIKATPTTPKVDAILMAFEDLNAVEKNAFMQSIICKMEGG